MHVHRNLHIRASKQRLRSRSTRSIMNVPLSLYSGSYQSIIFWKNIHANNGTIPSWMSEPIRANSFKIPTAETLYHLRYLGLMIKLKVLSGTSTPIDQNGRNMSAVKMVLVLVYELRLSACVRNKSEMSTHILTATEMSTTELSRLVHWIYHSSSTSPQNIRASFGTP